MPSLKGEAWNTELGQSMLTGNTFVLERHHKCFSYINEYSYSCCILIASKRFFIDGKWHTLINYERFFELLQEGREFGPEEYIGQPTPDWANWGKGGFDPSDERVYRKGKGPTAKVGVQAETESGGCG
jgi:tRNA wybutosine-synthesizing protein 1